MIGYALDGVQRVFALIPARGGSRRIPRKNLREFRGKGLLACAVEAARGSKYIDDLYVSTEDREITVRAKKLGVETIARPDCLASDAACSEVVLAHALFARGMGMIWYEWSVLLQATSPLRIAADIDLCLELAYRDGNGCLSAGPDGRQNGAVYAVRTARFLETLSFGGLAHYEMPEERSLDIDEEWQLQC